MQTKNLIALISCIAIITSGYCYNKHCDNEKKYKEYKEKLALIESQSQIISQLLEQHREILLTSLNSNITLESATIGKQKYCYKK